MRLFWCTVRRLFCPSGVGPWSFLGPFLFSCGCRGVEMYGLVFVLTFAAWSSWWLGNLSARLRLCALHLAVGWSIALLSVSRGRVPVFFGWYGEVSLLEHSQVFLFLWGSVSSVLLVNPFTWGYRLSSLWFDASLIVPYFRR